jgi:hypothetical protein
MLWKLPIQERNAGGGGGSCVCEVDCGLMGWLSALASSPLASKRAHGEPSLTLVRELYATSPSFSILVSGGLALQYTPPELGPLSVRCLRIHRMLKHP